VQSDPHIEHYAVDPALEPALANAVPMPQPGDVVKRHRLSTRIWHWVNAATLAIMLMSGLMIFNAHPRLYWGQYGANDDVAWLEIGAKGDQGYTRIGPVTLNTTGVLGHWTNADGEKESRAFPYWITIPSKYSLADARLWHFLFSFILAFGLLAYMLRSALNRHIKSDLHIRRFEWSPRHIWHDIKDHARLRFPTGAAALQYNILQKLSYIGVIFVLLPLVIFTGLTMSPNMNAAWGWLVDLFGGRQSARSLHFIAAAGLFGFFIVHMLMVLLAGPINEVRSIITGNFRLPGTVETNTEEAL
jgi:thiosulfate reductase cytochrome b subunit